jgi:hypothetical protein
MRLLGALALIGAVLAPSAVFAQALPHIVIISPIVYSDGSTQVLGADMSFDAWIETRPGEVISETFPGNGVADGMCWVEASGFTTIWAIGETMIVEITGLGSNYGGNAETEQFSIVLNSDNPQYPTGGGPGGEFILPVELTSFSAEPGAGIVTLCWETASEVENIGFNVLRSIERDGAYTKINQELIPGAGTTTEPQSYSYVDEDISGGLYFYQLEAVSTDGEKQLSGIVEVRPTPAVFALASGYPNPMTQSSEIAFQLPKDSMVSLRVYNMAGREVSILQQGTLQAGYYAKTWNGTDADGRTVGNGVYFVRMDAQGFNATRKLVVLR